MLIHNFLSKFYCHFLSISYGFRNIRLQSFQGLTLTFELWRSPEVENIFSIRKPIHDFLFNFYWHFLSISYGFRDFRFAISVPCIGLTLTFDLWKSPEVQKKFTIRKTIQDFLSSFYWNILSISYRFWDIRLQNFKWFDLDLWPLEITRCQKYFHHTKAHAWLPI